MTMIAMSAKGRPAIPYGGTVYYLDPVNGLDTNSGLTQASPFQNLQKALSQKTNTEIRIMVAPNTGGYGDPNGVLTPPSTHIQWQLTGTGSSIGYNVSRTDWAIIQPWSDTVEYAIGPNSAITNPNPALLGCNLIQFENALLNQGGKFFVTATIPSNPAHPGSTFVGCQNINLIDCTATGGITTEPTETAGVWSGGHGYQSFLQFDSTDGFVIENLDMSSADWGQSSAGFMLTLNGGWAVGSDGNFYGYPVQNGVVSGLYLHNYPNNDGLHVVDFNNLDIEYKARATYLTAIKNHMDSCQFVVDVGKGTLAAYLASETGNWANLRLQVDANSDTDSSGDSLNNAPAGCACRMGDISNGTFSGFTLHDSTIRNTKGSTSSSIVPAWSTANVINDTATPTALVMMPNVVIENCSIGELLIEKDSSNGITPTMDIRNCEIATYINQAYAEGSQTQAASGDTPPSVGQAYSSPVQINTIDTSTYTGVGSMPHSGVGDSLVSESWSLGNVANGITTTASGLEPTSGGGFELEAGVTLKAVLTVTAVSGTSPQLTVQLQTGPDGSTWSNVSGAAFTATATGSQTLTGITGLNTYLQWVVTVAGTSPSFTWNIVHTAKVDSYTSGDIQIASGCVVADGTTTLAGSAFVAGGALANAAAPLAG